MRIQFEQILSERSGEKKDGTPWKVVTIKCKNIDEPKYPKDVVFEVWGNVGNVIPKLGAGAVLNAAFDIEAREHDGRWYTTAKAYKLEVVEWGVQQKSEQPITPEPGTDDLPF